MVVDADSGKLIGEIPDTLGVHGVALVTDLHRGFISAGRANKVVVFDTTTLKATGEIATGQNPDAIIYDSVSRRVFTFNGRSNDVTAIDPDKNTVVGTLPVGGKPEYAVSDGKGSMFVNIEDKNEIVEFDAKTLKETHRWSIKPCDEPSGLAMDQKARRLFSVCGNKMMAIVDADSGKVIATPAIGDGVDGVAYDASAGNAYSSNGEGNITIVHQDSPLKYSVVATIPTQSRARTIALDGKTHKVFTVTSDFGPVPAATKENPRPRPPVLPDSFVVIEVGAK